MNEWLQKILDDIRRGSLLQFIITVVLIVLFTGYEVGKSISPITTTALLYWEDGFTNEEIERSSLHGICDRLDMWPMSVFIEKDNAIDLKCKVLKSRHMTRTASDWVLYQKRVLALRAKKRQEREAKILKGLPPVGKIPPRYPVIPPSHPPPPLPSDPPLPPNAIPVLPYPPRPEHATGQ